MSVTHRFTRGLCLVLPAVAVAAWARPASAGYVLERAFPALTFATPTDIQPANDGSGRMFVLEKAGIIRVFPADYHATTTKVFLDISYKVRTAGEAGLIGLAFDPGYAANGEFYIFYLTKYPSHSILSRLHVSADPDAADPASEQVLIDVPYPDPNVAPVHNGGQLRFGPDGYLYVSMGDNRTGALAQDLTALQGSILRINVHVDPTPLFGIGPPLYEIPPDNPFANNTSGYRPEIYAYGFRNPWRFTIDPYSRELWVCDVGEDTYEEIDIVGPGRDYGWPLMEGPSCYPSACDTTGRHLILPLYSYTHDEGSAIVGGAHYWSPRMPELAGIFVFADYTSGAVWGLHYDGAGTPERFTLATGAPTMLTVGVDSTGDVLMGSSDGNIYRLARIATAAGRLARGTRLLGNFPNPFNPSTAIRFVLDHDADVRLDIVSVRGERVRQFHVHAGTGAHEVRWDGTTNTGAHVASGVYFCRFLVDGAVADAARMVLVQ